MLRIKVLRPRTLSILTFVTVAACFVVYGSLINGTTTSSEPVTSTLSSDATAKLEVELITLRTSGFEPAQIVRPKGQFILLVDDRSGKEDSLLSLESLRGEKVRDINTKRMKFEWHDIINLPPGDYVLTSTAYTNSRCQITILP
jgi:hypothetical protein